MKPTIPVVSYIYRGFEIVLNKKDGRYYTQYGNYDSLVRATRNIDSHFRDCVPTLLPPKFRD